MPQQLEATTSTVRPGTSFKAATTAGMAPNAF